MSNTWDPLTIFWDPPRGLLTSLAPPPHKHHDMGDGSQVCLLGSQLLHSTAVSVLGVHPMVLRSPKCGVFCCNLGALSLIDSPRLCSLLRHRHYFLTYVLHERKFLPDLPRNCLPHLCLPRSRCKVRHTHHPPKAGWITVRPYQNTYLPCLY